jgi:hypothetical protein
MSICKMGVWRHYKGEYYFVLGIAQHTEREEQLVIYVPFTERVRAGLRLRARPLNGEKGFVVKEVVDGVPVDRFTFIGDEMPGAAGEIVG